MVEVVGATTAMTREVARWTIGWERLGRPWVKAQAAQATTLA